jgi:hypothetical protein
MTRAAILRFTSFLIVGTLIVSLPAMWNTLRNWFFGNPYECTLYTDGEITQYIQQLLDDKEQNNPNNRAIIPGFKAKGISRIESSDVAPGKILRAPLPNNSAARFQVDLVDDYGATIAYASVYDDCFVRWDSKKK